MKLSARHRHQLRRVLPELHSGLLDRLAFVGGFDLAKSRLFGGNLVDRYMLKDYGEAVRLCREFAARVPNDQWSHVWLASAYAQSEQLEQARVEAAEVLRINPGFTIQSAKRVVVYKDPKDAEHRIDGMRKAGLPEE
jgi:tetratricopeptide (TPR) repeat protein